MAKDRVGLEAPGRPGLLLPIAVGLDPDEHPWQQPGRIRCCVCLRIHRLIAGDDSETAAGFHVAVKHLPQTRRRPGDTEEVDGVEEASSRAGQARPGFRVLDIEAVGGEESVLQFVVRGLRPIADDEDLLRLPHLERREAPIVGEPAVADVERQRHRADSRDPDSTSYERQLELHRLRPRRPRRLTGWFSLPASCSQVSVAWKSWPEAWTMTEISPRCRQAPACRLDAHAASSASRCGRWRIAERIHADVRLRASPCPTGCESILP